MVQSFFSAAASSSWLVQVPGAGHGQFLKAPWLLDKAFDLLCGRGNDTHVVKCRAAMGWPAQHCDKDCPIETDMLRLGCSQETIDLTLHPMIAWFDQHLRPEVKVRLAPLWAIKHLSCLQRAAVWCESMLAQALTRSTAVGWPGADLC